MATLALGPHEGWEDIDWEFPTCPVNDCGRRCARLNIVCSSHWRLVEHGIRAVLIDAARDCRAATRTGDAAAKVGAYRRWEAAACRAIHCAEVHERG